MSGKILIINFFNYFGERGASAECRDLLQGGGGGGGGVGVDR